MSAPDPLRVEEAGLNAMSTQRQLIYDGWLLRLSAGKARRARSVNPHFGSTLPLGEKIGRCERLYASHELPALFRLTPFSRPRDLERELAARGYAPFDETLVQVALLERPPQPDPDVDVAIETAAPAAWVEAVALLRGSSPTHRDAHLERLANLPLPSRRVVARTGDRVVAVAQVVLEDGLAGVFDVVTAPGMRGRGIGTRVVAELLVRAWERGARAAYLQVDAGNAPALAVYRRFGFETWYTYHYCARADELR